MNSTIQISIALDTLNEVFAADPKAMEILFQNRVFCNQKLADHPTIVVDGDGVINTTIGVLGLLNGILERIAGAKVAAIWDDRESSWKLKGFAEYKK